MNEIKFYGNSPEDLKEMARNLFENSDENDPGSINYKRHLIRPKISWFRIFSHIIFLILFFIIMIKLLCLFNIKLYFSVAIACIILFTYSLINFKKILICLIHIYQYYAPTAIRMKCRFEPSCSQYMIMALEKYGVIKGLQTGIKRLCRCKVGNGGYDFP